MEADTRVRHARATGREAPPTLFRHEALLYAGPDEYAGRATSFVRDGLVAGDAILVAVPGPKVDLLRASLGADADAVTFVDMAEMGRNPARIIPAWRDFATYRGSRPARGIGEPIWAGRTSAELVECQLHESLLNAAFAGAADFWLLCPYDTSALGADVVAEALRSHPWVSDEGESRSSPAYAGPVRGLDTEPLPEPPASARSVTFTGGRFADLREFVARHAAESGVSSDRADDLLLAVHEVATNSVLYGGGTGVLRTWSDGGEFVCEVSDGGLITEPLVGRCRPAYDREGGRGLWIANQLCDLAQIRSGPAGTVVRLRVPLA